MTTFAKVFDRRSHPGTTATRAGAAAEVPPASVAPSQCAADGGAGHSQLKPHSPSPPRASVPPPEAFGPTGGKGNVSGEVVENLGRTTTKQAGRTRALRCLPSRNYRAAHRSSDESRLLRKHLSVREALVQTRSRMISLSRSLLRQEGIRVPSGSATTFAKRVRELELPDELLDAVEPMLKAHEQVCVQIEEVDRKVAQAVKGDERVQRLTTVPSIGPVTAATFIALVDDIDDIARFESKAKLASYLDLVPREYSSGEKQQRGHITKAGNSRMRSLLVECAWGVLRRHNPKSEPLVQWALRIAARRGKRIAAVALARKLAGILFAMTKNARSFEPNKLRGATAAQAA